jgi:hypothetical protein
MYCCSSPHFETLVRTKRLDWPLRDFAYRERPITAVLASRDLVVCGVFRNRTLEQQRLQSSPVLASCDRNLVAGSRIAWLVCAVDATDETLLTECPNPLASWPLEGSVGQLGGDYHDKAQAASQRVETLSG